MKFNHYTKDLEVIFVEQDTQLREAFQNLFKRFFKTVHPFENAHDAFLFYQENIHYIDIVITEVMLCGSTGIELCRNLKRVNSQQKIIVISACDDPEIIDELKALGIGDYIVKPPVKGELEHVFNTVGKELYELL